MATNSYLSNLRFFTGDGAEILMQKQYSLKWKILPAEQTVSAFYENPEGHVEGQQDLDTDVPCDVVIDVPGKIRATLEFPLPHGDRITMMDPLTGKENTIYDPYNMRDMDDEPFIITANTGTTINNGICYIESLQRIIFFSIVCYEYEVDASGELSQEISERRVYSNNIEIVANDGTEVVRETYNIFDFINVKTLGAARVQELMFRNLCDKYPSWSGSYDPDTDTIETASGSNDNLYGLSVGVIEQTTVAEFDTMNGTDIRSDALEGETVAHYLLRINCTEEQFPYVKFVGSVHQGKVSAGFMESTTVIVITDNGKGSNPRYRYPDLNIASLDSEKWRLHFKFQKDSEMQFVNLGPGNELLTTENMFSLKPSQLQKSAD